MFELQVDLGAGVDPDGDPDGDPADGWDDGWDDGWIDGWDGGGDEPREVTCGTPLAGPGGAVSSADDAAGLASSVGPGAFSAALLASLDRSELSDAGRVDALAAWQQLAGWVEVNTARLLGEHADAAAARARPGWAELERSSALAEVALCWRLSETSVHNRWALADALHTRLPRLAAALEAGLTTIVHVLGVAEATAQLTDEQARIVDERVEQRATRMTPARLRRAVRTVCTRLVPDLATQRMRQAHQERRVVRFTTPDGDTALQVWSGARDVQAIWSALTRLAGGPDADDQRTLGNRRVDALLGLCLGAVEGLPATAERYEDQDPDAGPAVRRVVPPVEAQVVIDLPTLLGLADNPAELRGYGPIPAGTAREWLRDATTWRRLVADPVSGHLLDFGPRVRFAPAKLAAFLQTRDQTCTFPGCAQPAHRCDADHEPAWQTDGGGGRTSARDMAMASRRHHRFKTILGWKVQRLPDGTSRWTSPTGHTYDSPRPRVLDTGDDP